MLLYSSFALARTSPLQRTRLGPWRIVFIHPLAAHTHTLSHSHITMQPKTSCPLKLSRVEPGQYLDGKPHGITRLLLEEVLVRTAGGAQPVVCVGPNAPVTGTLYCQKGLSFGRAVKPRSWLSEVIKNPMALLVKSRGVTPVSWQNSLHWPLSIMAS